MARPVSCAVDALVARSWFLDGQRDGVRTLVSGRKGKDAALRSSIAPSRARPAFSCAQGGGRGKSVAWHINFQAVPSSQSVPASLPAVRSS